MLQLFVLLCINLSMLYSVALMCGNPSLDHVILFGVLAMFYLGFDLMFSIESMVNGLLFYCPLFIYT